MINNYVIISTVIFLILALIWNKNDWGNFGIKTILAILTFYGGYIIFTQNLLG